MIVVSELGACFLVFPQLGEADSAVMQTLLAQVTEEVTEESSALLLPSSSSVAILAQTIGLKVRSLSLGPLKLLIDTQ